MATQTLYTGPTVEDLDRIPAELNARPQWVLWRGEDRIDQQTGEVKLNKIPVDPQTLHNADTTDPLTWGTFEQCVAALPVALEGWEQEDPSAYRGGGVGFVFASEDPYCGIDLDHCRDPDTGKVAPWAQAHVDTLASYTEVSPSGTGLHIFVQGTLPPKGRKKGPVEMYTYARFFTMTGWHLDGTPTTIEARHDVVTAFHGAIFGAPQPTHHHGPAPQAVSTPLLEDTVILDKARKAKNRDKFTRVWEGDTTGYGSPSQADMALCNLLAFWTQDPAQLDRLFRQSGLLRAKWDEQHGAQTYGERTIGEVLARQTDHYTPGAHQLGSTPEPVWPQCAPEAFSGLAGAIVKTIASETESDPVAILGQLLVMVGNAIGRTPYFPVEATRHYPTLFLCLVGATSKGRKGTSAAYPKRLLKEIDPDHARRVKSGLSSGEGVIWNVRDPTYGHNKKGEEVCEDEGESESAVLRQAWDCDDILNTLVSGRTRAPVQATGAHVSVIAHITANELRRTLLEVEAANGFGNRFLWLCVRRSQLLPEGGNYPHTALAPLRQQLGEAILAARKVACMTRSDAARILWRDIYTALAEGAPGLVGALTARAEAQVLRLSMLYALCDQSAVIDVPHLQAAYALWQYCEASARYVFGEALGDPLADSILQMLRYAGSEGLTRTDLNNALGRHYKSAALGQALALLLREGFARYVVEKTLGRPSEAGLPAPHRHTHCTN